MKAPSRKLFSLAYGSKVWPGPTGRRRVAAAVKLLRRSISGRATFAAPSAERRKLTWAISSPAISSAYCRTAGRSKSTCRPPMTAPRLPLPVVSAVAQPVAEDGVRVELRLEILEVEREVQDRRRRWAPPPAADSPNKPAPVGGADGAETREPGAAKERPPICVVLRAPLDHVHNSPVSEHRCSSVKAAVDTARRRRRRERS